MLHLALDPLSLPEQFPDASLSHVYRVRIIAQILLYEADRGVVVVTRVPLFPPFVPFTKAGDVSDEEMCEVVEVSKQWLNNTRSGHILDPRTLIQKGIHYYRSQIEIDLSPVLACRQLPVECVTPGSIVEIEAFYNPELYCIDCFCLGGSAAETATYEVLHQMTRLEPI